MNISKDKKKELQDQYKLMKPDMGIFAVINKNNAKYYLETTPDLKGRINSTKFKLNAGGHPNKSCKKIGRNLVQMYSKSKSLNKSSTKRTKPKRIIQKTWRY